MNINDEFHKPNYVSPNPRWMVRCGLFQINIFLLFCQAYSPLNKFK